MEWYFADGKEAVGPLSEQEFHSLVQVGKITSSTLVWHEGMTSWQAYSQVGPPAGGTKPVAPAFSGSPAVAACSQCGAAFPVEEMIQYDNTWVCARCKPLFVQKIKEGVGVAGSLTYAGFWIRFAAKFIDGIILWVISVMFNFGARFFTTAYADPFQNMTMQVFLSLVQVVIGAAYATWFLGRYGATPGKMAFNLRVVTPEGGEISYLRALGRHFAEWISGLLLLIGYIMAAFDSEKRALHDRICNTRVVRR